MDGGQVMGKFKHKKILLFLIGIFLLFGAKWFSSHQTGFRCAADQSEVIIEIPFNSSTANIAKILKENKLIKSEIVFRIASKLSKTDGKLKAGRYLLKRTMSSREIIDHFIHGAVIKDTISFTIPEGFEFNQIVARLEDKGLIDKEKFIQIANEGDFDYRFLKNVPKGNNRLEGFLFPDTYEVPKNITEEKLINMMLNRFNDIFKEEYYEKAEELGMNVNEIVTMASIIEREVKVEKERPLVAGIFYNRLKKRMLLQSCATVQYVIKERLTFEDIAIDSPYNTYKYIGLPPTPIASPGEASIKAALYPMETEYLYFVASTNGEHVFNKTYEEHKKAKKKIQTGNESNEE
jgi:UPF0755 protein